MRFIVHNKLIKYLLIIGEVGVFSLLAFWVSKTYVAEVMARIPTAQSLQLAVRLDPGNPEYHRQLGRLFEYSVADINFAMAEQELKRATELNPHDPQAWLDLGHAFESQGKTAEAEACVRQAHILSPTNPNFHWIIGNFYLLHGNVDEAFHHFKIVMEGDSQYNQALFSTAWKATEDGNKILAMLIPNNVPAEFEYLNFLLAQKRYLEAKDIWNRIITSSQAFPPRQAGPYLDNLLGSHRPQEAYQIWTDLLKRGLIKPIYQETSRNLIVNGDFEEHPLNMGFDWRIGSFEDAEAELDETTYHSPSHALLIQFSGKQNLDYRQIYQFVRVQAGRPYRLRGLMKTEEITTDSGPRLEVRDAYDPGALEKFSDHVTGTTTGWTTLTLDFNSGPKTELIIVGIARLPSHKLNNKIAGKVWVDDLSLVPSTPENAAQQGKFRQDATGEVQ